MKICIVKLSAMGDIIHAMVVLQFIKKQYPSIQIDWLVEEAFQGVLENNPHIDNILPINLKSIKKNKLEIFNQIKILRKYAKSSYDLVIDAQGLIKSALVSKIVSNGSKIVGFDKSSTRESFASLFYDQVVKIGYDQNTIDRNVTVIMNALGLNYKVTDIIQKEKFLFFSNSIPVIEGKYNIFVIGSTWQSRNYPKESYLEIANQLKTPTYIVWGSDEEYKIASWIEERSPYVHILKKGNLDNLKNVIGYCQLLIGNDTGPTHMAWGLNVPSITLFGPTPVNRIYITPINKALKSSSKVNHYKLNKNDFSISEIKVQDIINIVKEIL